MRRKIPDRIFPTVFPETYQVRPKFLRKKEKTFALFCKKHGFLYDSKNQVPYNLKDKEKSLIRSFLKVFDKNPDSTWGILNYLNNTQGHIHLGYGIIDLFENSKEMISSLKYFETLSQEEILKCKDYPKISIGKFLKRGDKNALYSFPFFKYYPRFKGIEKETYQGRQIVIPNLDNMLDFGSRYGTCTRHSSSLSYAYEGKIFRLFLRNSDGVIDRTFVIEHNGGIKRVYGLKAKNKESAEDWTSREVYDFVSFLSPYLSKKQVEIIVKNRWAHDYSKDYGDLKKEAFSFKRKFYYEFMNKKVISLEQSYHQFAAVAEKNGFTSLIKALTGESLFKTKLEEENKLARECLNLMRFNSPVLPTLFKCMEKSLQTYGDVTSVLEEIENFSGSLESKLEKISRLSNEEFREFFWSNFEYFQEKYLLSGEKKDLNEIPFFKLFPEFRKVESLVYRGQSVVVPTSITLFRDCGEQLGTCTANNQHVSLVVNRRVLRLFLKKDEMITGTILISRNHFYALKAGRRDFEFSELEEVLELLRPILKEDLYNFIKSHTSWGHYKSYKYYEEKEKQQHLLLTYK